MTADTLHAEKSAASSHTSHHGAPHAAPPENGPDAGPSDEPPGLSGALQALRGEVMNALHERLHLVTLEFKQVGLSAAEMVLLATVAALMLAGAWATILTAVYLACRAHGMPWGVALLVLLVLNLAGACLAWLKAHALSEDFTLPATRRMLKDLSGPSREASHSRTGRIGT